MIIVVGPAFLQESLTGNLAIAQFGPEFQYLFAVLPVQLIDTFQLLLRKVIQLQNKPVFPGLEDSSLRRLAGLPFPAYLCRICFKL